MGSADVARIRVKELTEEQRQQRQQAADSARAMREAIATPSPRVTLRTPFPPSAPPTPGGFLGTRASFNKLREDQAAARAGFQGDQDAPVQGGPVKGPLDLAADAANYYAFGEVPQPLPEPAVTPPPAVTTLAPVATTTPPLVTTPAPTAGPDLLAGTGITRLPEAGTQGTNPGDYRVFTGKNDFGGVSHVGVRTQQGMERNAALTAEWDRRQALREANKQAATRAYVVDEGSGQQGGGLIIPGRYVTLADGRQVHESQLPWFDAQVENILGQLPLSGRAKFAAEVAAQYGYAPRINADVNAYRAPAQNAQDYAVAEAQRGLARSYREGAKADGRAAAGKGYDFTTMDVPTGAVDATGAPILEKAFVAGDKDTGEPTFIRMSEVSQELNHAGQAIAAGANREAVWQRLQQRFANDPIRLRIYQKYFDQLQ